MAGMGPAPKEGKLGRYQSELDKPEVELEAGSFEAPKLPGYREYSYKVKRWWDTWVASPQAATFTATDWQRLLMLAPMVDAYYRMVGDPRSLRSALLALTEIRQNESLLGATHLDRLRGRIKIDRESSAGADDDDETATPEGVAVLAHYRKELGA